MVRARSEVGLTQEALAERMGTTQSAIARLEGGRLSPSVETLRRYAAGVGKKLRVEFVWGEPTVRFNFPLTFLVYRLNL